MLILELELIQFTQKLKKKYNPAGFDSRLGIHYDQLKDIDFKNIDGYIFTLCVNKTFLLLKILGM